MTVPAAPDDKLLLDALARGSRALIDAHFWSDGVDQLLEALGQASGASRVWIFQLLEINDQGVVQDYVFEWAAAPRYRQLTHKCFRFFTSTFDDPVYCQLVSERQQGEAQRFVIAEMPNGSLRDNLESQGIDSMVTVPIMVDGRWWGTLGIDDCERALRWEGAGLNALRVAAELIASAIYRHQLTSRQRQIELLQRVTDCGIWEIDLQRGSTWCSRSLLRTLCYPARYARLPLRRLLRAIAAEDRQRLWHILRTGKRDRQHNWRLDVRLNTANSVLCWHEMVIEAIPDDSGGWRGLAGLAIDISQRKWGEQQALSAAEYDDLTGVLNRRGLGRHLEAALARQTSHHLLLVDIDHFKRVNDRCGHPAGDALLRLLTHRMARELRPEDGLARLGGEEFALVVSGMSDDDVCRLAERLRQRIDASPFELESAVGQHGQVSMTVSLGIARLTRHSTPHHSQALATAQADQALYAAKHAGRNRVACYWLMPDSVPQNLTEE
ncbi:diguanylate cyclase (GGDEF) domain-containing protein [Franzmannia pantelleriensis]|uniref:Diguanylate cyclase (GGDEF) domain-containing protein n=1 Tax=Franzmannia pantelleriensis TaxID=48727 RepID=A0A1G9T4M7_9GAMM|nr:diguanylate cyclase [Halomonas pantelleriensis]SDM42673.1 diguanylate cyclase (GGDEF) domain-containing protein [Halomonas pantelleriensis]